MITVACVRTGSKFPFDYVVKLRNMVERYLPVEHNFVCFTDSSERASGVETVDVSEFGLAGWWAKMLLFNTVLRGDRPTIYLDLDTVVTGDISPLAVVAETANFSICENFHRLRGHKNWCRYGSCCMTFAPGWGGEVYSSFQFASQTIMKRSGNRGDQYAIEQLVGPNVPVLQSLLPKGFFLHYKDLGSERPKETRLVIFGGRTTPANCVSWPRKAWK